MIGQRAPALSKTRVAVLQRPYSVVQGVQPHFRVLWQFQLPPFNTPGQNLDDIFWFGFDLHCARRTSIHSSLSEELEH